MKDEPAARFSVSLPADLLRKLDAMIGEKGNNRSLAIADISATTASGSAGS